MTEGKANPRNLESYSLHGKMSVIRMVLKCQVQEPEIMITIDNLQECNWEGKAA